jgi:hypothetical protein
MSNSSARATVAERMGQETPALVARHIRAAIRVPFWRTTHPDCAALAINIFPI